MKSPQRNPKKKKNVRRLRGAIAAYKRKGATPETKTERKTLKRPVQEKLLQPRASSDPITGKNHQ